MRKLRLVALVAALFVSVMPAAALAHGCDARPYLDPKSALGETQWHWEFCIPEGESWNLDQDKANTKPAKAFASSVLKVARGVDEAWAANFSLASPVARNLYIQWGSPASGFALANTDLSTGAISVFANQPRTFPPGQPDPEFSGIENYEIFAHEFAHLLQLNQWRNEIADPGIVWIRESSAEAFAWLLFPYSTHIARNQEYDLPLHRPSLAAEREMQAHLVNSIDYFRSPTLYAKALVEIRESAADYRRAHFFHHAARDLASGGGFGFLDQAFGRPIDVSHRGLDWLDKLIRAHRRDGLFDYYPGFIANHVTDLDNQFTEQARRLPALAYRPAGPSDKTGYAGQVEAVAADPRRVSVSFDAGWTGSPKPGDRVYLFVQGFSTKQSPADPLTLVVDKQVVAKDGEYRRLVWASPKASELKLLNRVVNVAPQARDTRPMDYRLEQSLKKVHWKAPPCVVTNEPFEIAIDPDISEATQEEIAEQIRLGHAIWRVQGGRLLDAAMGRVVVDKPGVLRMSLVLKYGDDPKRQHAVEIASVKVEGADCQVRVTIPGEKAARLTYTRKGDYTELASAGESEKIYLGRDRMAVHDPAKGGWQAVPPQAQAMMQGMLGQRLGPEAARAGPPWVKPGRNDAFAMNRVPWAFQRLWDYDAVTDHLTGNPKAAGIARYDCGAAVENCKRIRITQDGGEILLEYDEFGRLVALNAGADGMRFEHGIFDIGKPPGWGDGPDPVPGPDAPRPPDATGGGKGERGPGSREQAPERKVVRPGMPGATSAGPCDCSCETLRKRTFDRACAMQCAPQWMQCVPSR